MSNYITLKITFKAKKAYINHMYLESGDQVLSGPGWLNELGSWIT